VENCHLSVPVVASSARRLPVFHTCTSTTPSSSPDTTTPSFRLSATHVTAATCPSSGVTARSAPNAFDGVAGSASAPHADGGDGVVVEVEEEVVVVEVLAEMASWSSETMDCGT
jgi:hypothetical protein